VQDCQRGGLSKASFVEIEDIHRLLDSLENTISQLATETRESIQPTEAGELCLIIGEIMGWGSAYASEFPKKIGVNATTLSRFLRLDDRFHVSTKESRVIADRIRVYLRSLDQRTEFPTKGKRRKPRREVVAASSVRFDVPAQEWRLVDTKGDLKLKIAAVSSILDSIILQIAHANCPESEQALTKIERQLRCWR
jgi:hypothetical protein